MNDKPTHDEQGAGGPDTGADLDARFTHGLIFDVFEVLEQHGYRRPDGPDESVRNRAVGRAVSVLLDLVRAFEGTER